MNWERERHFRQAEKRKTKCNERKHQGLAKMDEKVSGVSRKKDPKRFRKRGKIKGVERGSVVLF